MRFEIKRIQKSINVTTIFVTHDQTEALAMADRIVVMNEGRIVQIGSPHDIYYHPNSKFTSEFIGETNFLEGIVQHSERQNVIVNLSPEVTLKAFSTTNEMPSGKVLVGVRPEHIRLKREQPQTTNNVLQGRLIDLTFMGATLRYHIEFGDKIIAVDGVGSSERTAKYNASEKVFLEIEPKNCLVLPA